MRNEKGITLISLVIIIIVMLIIAGIVTYSGTETIYKSKKVAFISEMEIIQGKVNTIYEKRKLNQEDKEYYNNLGQEISVIETNKINTILGDSSSDGFRYFSKDNLKELDIQNINQDVIINFDTREVISIDGIEIEGIIYYKLKDIPNYEGYGIEYTKKDTQQPTFNIDVIELENSWKFILRDITYDNNINGGTVSYKLHKDTNWIIEDNVSFEVDKPGLYDIKLTDKVGNSTVKTIYTNNEIYIENFETYNYLQNGTQINSCSNSILDITSNSTDAYIYMNHVTSFNPTEYRYVEIRYKTTNNSYLSIHMIENPIDDTYFTGERSLNMDGEWHTIIIDLWENENIKNRDNITGWRLDWGANEIGVSMQIDYIKIINNIDS